MAESCYFQSPTIRSTSGSFRKLVSTSSAIWTRWPSPSTIPRSWPGGGTGGARQSRVFPKSSLGRFDGSRCLAYLKRTAQSVENYNSIDIFTIPLYGRSFRIAVLGVDTVAASNHDDPAVIRGMVDRSRRSGVSVWRPGLAAQILQAGAAGQPNLAGGATSNRRRPALSHGRQFFPSPPSLVISASYNPLHLPLRTGVLHLRAEAWAGSDEDARNISDKANVFLSMFHSAEMSVGSAGNDADVKAVFDSLQVRQEGNRAVLSAILPSGVFRKLRRIPRGDAGIRTAGWCQRSRRKAR